MPITQAHFDALLAAKQAREAADAQHEAALAAIAAELAPGEIRVLGPAPVPCITVVDGKAVIGTLKPLVEG